MMAIVSATYTFVLLVSVVQGQATTRGQNSVCHGYEDNSLVQTKLDTVISILRSNDQGKYDESANLPVDCKQILDSGLSRGSGVYAIFNPVNSVEKREVYCDMDTEGGGWMVLQRRVSDAVDFNRVWAEYADGFGDLTGNHWLGNELLHRLTYYRPQELRVELQNWENVTAYAKYQEFRVDSESDKYRLSVSGYSGNAGDSLSYHNGARFCTKDREYDTHSTLHCAKELEGAWWFKACEASSLNGPYYKTETIATTHYHGVSWDSFGGNTASMKMSEMKVRPQ